MKKQRIIFLCTGNSARSQMAEGLLRQMAGVRCEVFSAGTHPAELNPHAVAAMREIGIDISGHRSRPVDELAGQAFDCVFTVGDHAKEACPLFPGGGKRIHHSFEDPAAAPRSSNRKCSAGCAMRSAGACGSFFVPSPSMGVTFAARREAPRCIRASPRRASWSATLPPSMG